MRVFFFGGSKQFRVLANYHRRANEDTRHARPRWRAVRPSRSSPIVWSMLNTLATRTSAARQFALQHQKLDCPWPQAPSTLIHALSNGDREARQRGPRAQVMEFNLCPGDQSPNPPSRICTLRRSYRPALATTRTKDSPRLRYYRCKVGSKQATSIAPAVRRTSRITHLSCYQAGARTGCSSPMLRIWCWTGPNLPVKTVGVSRREEGCE